MNNTGDTLRTFTASSTEQVAWIAVDWGTSRLRLWSMRADNTPIEAVDVDKGAGTMFGGDFECVLYSLIAPLLTTEYTLPVIACGMVGARNGWLEAPYESLPTGFNTAFRSVVPKLSHSGFYVHILSGLCQHQPPDIMRGEETQIRGFLSQKNNYSGLICLPGTHTKWVFAEKGEIIRFQTSMTGELLTLLLNHSTLSSVLTLGKVQMDEFVKALSSIWESPMSLIHQFFTLRAESLLDGLSQQKAFSRLSGLLIGADVLSIEKERNHIQSIDIIGQNTLAHLYQSAIEHKGIVAYYHNVNEFTLEGLIAAYYQREE
ncbi:MAG: 2-dehydro-3-deoxygalactonokinase [Ostreibacterium sp.]